MKTTKINRLAVLLGAAFLLLCASAQAKTQWFYGATSAERQAIPIGEVREVPAHSSELTLKLRPLGRMKIKLTCAVTGVESFWNELGVGRDETKSIAFDCTTEATACPPSGAVTITPYTPWTSTLMEGPVGLTWPLPDEWQDVRIGVRCGATYYGVFAGNLRPGSGDGDEQGQTEGQNNDEADSFVGFRNGNGALTNPNGDTLSIEGFYHFGPSRKVEVVTGEL